MQSQNWPNQTDVPKSRFDFVNYTDEAKTLNTALTMQAMSIESIIETMPNSREKALALTNLEQAIMWARKALRDVGGPRDTTPVHKA